MIIALAPYACFSATRTRQKGNQTLARTSACPPCLSDLYSIFVVGVYFLPPHTTTRPCCYCSAHLRAASKFQGRCVIQIDSTLMPNLNAVASSSYLHHQLSNELSLYSCHDRIVLTSGAGKGGTNSLAASTHGPAGAEPAFPSSAPMLAFSCACERGLKNMSSCWMSGAAV